MVKTVYVKFDKLLGETPSAYLLKIEDKEIWFPARCCYNFILNNKLGGNMRIPAWLYIDRFGCEPDETDAGEEIIRHVPEPKEQVCSNIIKELER
jgi:hypothetical protein